MADDELFAKPFIDVDEWREAPRRHRYVHGGFEGTHTLFSFYLPPAENYQGRFYQYLEGGAGGHENLIAPGDGIPTPWRWLFELCFDELGGYIVESNQGHYPGEGLGFANDVELYRASAQAARYSRVVAEEMYGTGPHDGYIFGASGGGIRSAICLENVTDVWSGGVPHVAGTVTVPLWSAQALATELLRKGQLEHVVDALEPGGSGDPFAGLDTEQAAALANLFRMGFSPTLATQMGRFMMWVFNIEMIREKNPEYLRDFWTKPGFLGYENPESLRDRLVDEKTVITEVLSEEDARDPAFAAMLLMTAGASGSVNPGLGAKVDLPDPDRLFQARLRVVSGAATGREMVIFNVINGVLTPFPETCPELFDGVKPGDEVVIDNRDYLAYQYYHRHNVAGAIPQLDGGRGVIDQFRHLACNGVPIYPQMYCEAFAGDGHPLPHRGNLKKKTIFFMCKQDIMVPHAPGVTYHQCVRQQLGDRTDDLFRIWWVDNATHGRPEFVATAVSETEMNPRVWRSRLVSYDPLLAQALSDVTVWAEDGTPPPSNTNYSLNFDNELVLPASAAERGGIQPVVTLTAPDGSPRLETRVGAPVTLIGTAEVPPGTGTIVRAQLDPEGQGTFGDPYLEADGGSGAVTVKLTHTYETPGSYFPSFRAGSHRHGRDGQGAPVWNVARMRVVVSP